MSKPETATIFSKMKNRWSRISWQPQRWAQPKLHRRDILEKWANMSNRPPSHLELESTRCCIRQKRQDVDNRVAETPKPLRTGKHQVLHETEEARCWQQGSRVKVCTQNRWNPSSHPSSHLHIVQETLDLRTPGCAETQGWEWIIRVCIRNCGTPGLAEAMLRVCISSWLGTRMATTVCHLAASVVQRKNWAELPSVSCILGTRVPPFHF